MAVSNFFLTVEAIMGSGTSGSIAVDELDKKLSMCLAPGSCDFQNDMCTYRNDRQRGDLDWMIGSGERFSMDTGPSVDHTLGINKQILCHLSKYICKSLSHMPNIDLMYIWSSKVIYQICHLQTIRPSTVHSYMLLLRGNIFWHIFVVLIVRPTFLGTILYCEQ